MRRVTIEQWNINSLSTEGAEPPGPRGSGAEAYREYVEAT